ncbi:hypothetical protein C6356_00615 [Bacillus wiedmannii]|uniref:hypothetical protein n=1 Tax=Bacillus wiedmannii TaxID=1890302 RepID=UPI000D09751C|nr:hypothetical protein [Bacillus wiedmannii]PRT06960.1 hypothetical protein C6356_00615 [Bacillus wiedmannii]
MEKRSYCHYCNEEHIVSETKDSNGNVVGLFCNREKALIKATTTKWNGVDIYGDLREFARRNVDLVAVNRINPEKVEGLSRKMAYLFLQTPEAKESSLNYYFAVYHMTRVIVNLRSELRAKRVGL